MTMKIRINLKSLYVAISHRNETRASSSRLHWENGILAMSAVAIVLFSASALVGAVRSGTAESQLLATHGNAPQPMRIAFPVSMAAGGGGNPNPGIHPVNSQPYGLSYSDWSAKWWQWVLQIPAATNPNLDATGANCAEGQSGQVWFLAGSFGTLPTPIDRSCTIPTGTSVLLPVLNQADGAALLDCDGPPPFDVPCSQFTFNGKVGIPALREEAKVAMDNPALLKLSLDGVAVANIPAYRVQSPVFSFTLTTDNVITYLLNVFGFGGTQPPGTYTPAVSDGYWIMFTPLTPGKHTIHFEGVQAGGFATGGITYHLNVVPKGQLQ
jgi:hypothetical protein